MASRNISSFITWFLNTIYSLASTLLGFLDNIYLTNNVTLLDFTITIFILGIVISILIASPGNVMRIEKKQESKSNKKGGKNA